jgi:hypothetical protein
MDQDPPRIQQGGERRIACAQVINPNRGIDEDQMASDFRRGMAFKSGLLQPSLAKRRAASRSVKAVSASRTKADFSVKPV